jgi:Subtilase family
VYPRKKISIWIRRVNMDRDSNLLMDDVSSERFAMAGFFWMIAAAVVVTLLSLSSSSGAEARLGNEHGRLAASWWPADESASYNETTIVVVPNQFIVRFSSDSDELLDYDTVEQRAALVARLLQARILYVYHHTFSGVALQAHSDDSNHSSSSSSSSTTATRSGTTTIPLKLSRVQEILSQAAAASSSSSSSRRSKGLFYAIEEVRLQTSMFLHRVLCDDSGGGGDDGALTIDLFVGQNHRFALDVIPPESDLQWTNQFQVMTANNTIIPIGLDRIDQVTAQPLDGQYRHVYNGTGVTVYVIDSGLRTTHVEFEGRATCGYDYYYEPNVTRFDRRCADDYEHGTHVAGTIGGRRAGVAKQVSLVSVKVLDATGGGTDAAVLAGMDYVLGQVKSRPGSGRAVVNMSLGRIYALRYNLSVRRLIRHGIVVVAAAGNLGRNACLGSPGSARPAITVGSFEYSDVFASDLLSSFSNHGRCIDINAYVTRPTSCWGSSRPAISFSHTRHLSLSLSLFVQTRTSHIQCWHSRRHGVHGTERHEHGGAARGGRRGALLGKASLVDAPSSPQCTRERRSYWSIALALQPANAQSALVHWQHLSVSSPGLPTSADFSYVGVKMHVNLCAHCVAIPGIPLDSHACARTTST